MSQEPDPPAPPPHPSPNDFGPWVLYRLRELGFALLRAVGKASRSGVFTFKNHVVVDVTRRQIVQPLAESYQQARDVVQSAKKSFEAAADQELFTEVPPEQLEVWIRNARWGWVTQAAFALVAAIVACYGACSPGFLGANMMLGGMLMTLYAVARGLRIARDVLIFRVRRPVTFRAFWERIEDHWNPLPREHVAYWPVVAGVLPLCGAIFLVSPVLVVVL